MTRLCGVGHEVTLFTSGYPGCKGEEIIDGIRVVRRGDRFSVYRKARAFYEEKPSSWDVVIDEINTIPFMCPRFVDRGERIVALIHQLAREFWFYELPYPLAWIGNHVLEDRWLKNYRDVVTITVSESTKEELLGMGFRDVRVVPNGLNAETLDMVPPKTPAPSMVFVGRLKKTKRPEEALKAYKIIKEKHPDLHMTVVGDGDLRKDLEKCYPDVEFTGYLDRASRDAVVSRSWMIAVPGIREGWGQVVTDSNALGTPAIGYDIPGLRDSIHNGYNGLLSEPTPMAMACEIEKLISDDNLRSTFSENALKWSKRFSWDASAAEFEKVLR
ncbi:MAG: glycosyltransferase family 4 protein [Methanomassiliicoccus sp.]|nr:glycosyltransferase family 4 protein [Methanomassiliicoccus sp.]